MSKPPKPKIVRSVAAKARHRGVRIFNKLFWGGLLDFESVERTPQTKLGYLLEQNLAEHTPKGVKPTRVARDLWLSTHGSNVAWERMSPGVQARWMKEYLEWFAKHQNALLKNSPPRVKTASQYFYHFAAQLLKRAKSLSKAMALMKHSEEYETMFNEYQRTINRATIYRGIAERTAKKELEETRRA